MSLHDGKEFSCVYCWHHQHYHVDGPCSAIVPTTAGDLPCNCPGFHSRKLAIELIAMPSDPPVYHPPTTDKAH